MLVIDLESLSAVGDAVGPLTTSGAEDLVVAIGSDGLYAAFSGAIWNSVAVAGGWEKISTLP